MKRSWTLWLIFVGCAAIVIAALAWVSLIVLQLEEAGNESRRQALLEENTRLALWRMESMLAPFVAQENARPYYSYQAFFPAERAYTRMLARLEPNEILIPSPLLTEGSPHARLYFQLGPAGELSSPQIPAAPLNGRAIEGYADAKQIEESARRLKQFASDIPRQALLKVAPSEWLPMERSNGVGNDVASLREAGRFPASAEKSDAMPSLDEKVTKQKALLPASEAQSGPKAQSQVKLAQEVIKNSPAQVANQVITLPQQEEQRWRNEAEYQARVTTNVMQDQLTITRNVENAVKGKASKIDQTPESPRDKEEGQIRAENSPPRPVDSTTGRRLRRSTVSQPAEIKTSLLKPVWIQSELILVRRVKINQEEYLQGCWLDWPRLQDWLTTGIRDLLPQARLEARKDGNDQARSLAALPVLIQPGQIAANLSPAVSPLRLSLWIAWLCVMTAIIATAILFWGTHALSERRAAFVSAVTHELRTPLTTFRIYTEMLAEGMVPDAEQRRQYLNTLKQEAERQYHLIENVLAYSRMERGRYSGQKEVLSLGTWLERIQPRLAELAERSAMALIPADEKGLTNLQILTDAGALDKRIHIEAVPESQRVRIRVRDHGPGIDSKDIAKLFQPFHKSARDAANSAPGVGLGLSLCRRLAQSIGGELSLEQNSDTGAVFSLLLPSTNKKLVS
jgi:signal transduction histidine kinase